MNILITDNGNYFVAHNGNYGYFDQNGDLLRVSDEDDWNWANRYMEEFSGDPTDLNLDLQKLQEERIPSLEEINSSNKKATFADLFASIK